MIKHFSINNLIGTLKLLSLLLLLTLTPTAVVVALILLVVSILAEIKRIADKVSYQILDSEFNSLINEIEKQVSELNINTYEYIIQSINTVLDKYNVILEYKSMKESKTQLIFYYKLGYTYKNENKKFTKIADVKALIPELALELNSQITVVSGKDAMIGLVINHPKAEVLQFQDLLMESKYKTFVRNNKDGLPFLLGCDKEGNIISGDATKFPHLLIAGETNSGKSNALQVLLTSLILNKTNQELKLVLNDFKLVELAAFENSSYLLGKISYDVRDFEKNLDKVIREMESRLVTFKKLGVKNLAEYNIRVDKKLPYILFVIEELASIMLMDDRELKDILENKLAILASKCRAVGIHLIITVQKANKNIITTKIKTNIPGRLALKVADIADSQLMIGNGDAVKLEGNGDAILNGIKLQIAFLDGAVQEDLLSGKV